MPTMAIASASRVRRDSPSGEPRRVLKGEIAIGANLAPGVGGGQASSGRIAPPSGAADRRGRAHGGISRNERGNLSASLKHDPRLAESSRWSHERPALGSAIAAEYRCPA